MAGSILSWVNGQQSEKLSVFDRAVAFGDGLFETILVTHGQAPLLPLHLARLERGLKALHIPLSIDQAEEDISQAIESLDANKRFKLKYIVSRGESEAGYKPNAGINPTRLLQCAVFDRDLAALQQGIKATVCQWLLSCNSQLAGIKHLNRLDQVMAAKQIPDDCYEGILRDSSGCFIEGTMSNFFVRTESGLWQTPKLDVSGVKGVMRGHILSEMKARNIAVEETRIASLARISEMFISNALIGVVPVLELDGQCFTISDNTLAIQNHINNKLGL